MTGSVAHLNNARAADQPDMLSATPDSKGFDDPGVFVPIELVNKIRPRVKSWRENDYPGVTGITRRLLHHWQDTDPDCQSS